MARKRFLETLEEQYTKKGAKSVLRYTAPDGKPRYVAGGTDPSGEKINTNSSVLSYKDGEGNTRYVAGVTDPSGKSINNESSVLSYKDAEDNTRYVASSENPSGIIGNMTEVTWLELKTLRDGGNLVAGSLYRITDYVTTTAQENTQSAGHQFDIVLLALSANKLAEEGWAMMNESNIYDVTFNDAVVKCYLYQGSGEGLVNIVDCSTLLGMDDVVLGEDIVVNESNKTAQTNDMPSSNLAFEGIPYNYFQNSNLSAWKVWYCLDNDTARFAWADDSVDEGNLASITINVFADRVYLRDVSNDTILADINAYAWTTTYIFMGNEEVETMYTNSETPQIGDKTWNSKKQSFTGSEITSYTPAHEGTGPNGRGVIYRLIDEFNNDIKYDFKNIQFKRTITDGQYDANGTETWCYTLNIWYNNMCQDASIVGNTLPNDEGYISGVYGNVFGYATAFDLKIDGVDTFAFALGNNVALSFEDDWYYGSYCNTIGNAFYNNTIGNNFNSNIIGNSFSDNTIGNNFYYNTIGNYLCGATISDNTGFANYGNNGVELATKDDLN